MLASARQGMPARARSNVCRLNDENVVKPPQRPTSSARRQPSVSGACPLGSVNVPRKVMANEPDTFTASVPRGKARLIGSSQTVMANLSTLPSAPPPATYSAARVKVGDPMWKRLAITGWVREFYCGAPDRIRTCDLSLRRRTLYPAELRARGGPGPARTSRGGLPSSRQYSTCEHAALTTRSGTLRGVLRTRPDPHRRAVGGREEKSPPPVPAHGLNLTSHAGTHGSRGERDHGTGRKSTR